MKEGWDAVRRVRIGGRSAIRRVLLLKPEHAHRVSGTSSLGIIRRCDVGRFYVLDKYEAGDDIDVIDDKSPLPFTCTSTLPGANPGESFRCTLDKDHAPGTLHVNNHVTWR